MTSRAVPIAVLLLAIATGASAQPMGKSKEYRSLNTELYKISIQKDGQLDVFLATDTPVIVDAFPMIWFDGEAEPERLKIAGKWTERLAVEDKLGQGQGIVHQYKGGQWSLRAYPTRPYFAVQLAYTNETNKPVRIKALLPWCIGGSGKGMILLGPGTDEARILSGTTTGAPISARGSAQSEDVVAILSMTTGQSLIAGFITQDFAHGLIEVGEPAAEDKSNPSGLNHFRAMSLFDKPVELAPGETLYSEVLYLSISEQEPVVGLQRYARAVQVANNLSSAGQNAPLHAWVVSLEEAEQSPAALTEKLSQVRKRVPVDIIGHVLVGSPVDAARRFVCDPSIPEAIRAAGYIPVLWYDPLAAGTDSAPNLNPDAMRADGKRLREVNGFSEIAGIHLNSDIPSMRAAIKAFREGLGPDSRIYGSAPSLLAGTLFDGVITTAGEELYLAPQPTRQAVFFPRNEGGNAHRAGITAATLLGCGLLLPLPSAEDKELLDLITQVLPSPASAAQPVDLFASRHPGVFHQHTKVLDGAVHVAAIANWNNELPLSTSFPLARFGFTAGAYYTVFDYWNQKYLGTAADTLNVTIPAGEATVLVFRPALGHPMLVSTGQNSAQNYPTLRREDWDPQARTLTVERAGTPMIAGASRFTLAVPPPYRLVGVTSNTSVAAQWDVNGTSVTVTMPEGNEAPLGFVAQFDVVR